MNDDFYDDDWYGEDVRLIMWLTFIMGALTSLAFVGLGSLARRR